MFCLVIVNWTQPSLTVGAQQEPFAFKPVVSIVSKTYIHFHRRQTALFVLLRHWSVSHGALFNHTSQLLAVFASTSYESGQTDILKGARCFCSMFPSLTQSHFIWQHIVTKMNSNIPQNKVWGGGSNFFHLCSSPTRLMCRYWLLLSNIKMIIKRTHTWEGRDYGEMLPVLLWNLFLRTNNATGRTSRMKPSTPSIAQCLQAIPWQLSEGDVRTVGENDLVLLLGLQSHRACFSQSE